MRKIKEILRLKFEAKFSHERIAAATGASKGAVSNYVQRAVQKGLSWPLPADLDESTLERLLFRQAAPREEYAQPDFPYLHQELKRKSVTLQLLWEEYHATHGERAYRYSQFCVHYQRFRDSLARSMRQVHRAGEKLFIDYSGDTVMHRENRKMARLLKRAQLKERSASMEGIDYRSRSGLDRPQLASLTTCDWIRSNQSLLIQGATGSGKTYLACALAHQACRAGLSAWYVRAPRLFEELNLCHADGTFRKRLMAIAKINLLVIDDFAISPIGPRERNDLLELLDDRAGNSASILASQLPVDHWHEYLNDPTLADAIMDRLVHSSHRIQLQAKESIRKRYATKAPKPGAED
jgi:DNA replication protein DnaC